MRYSFYFLMAQTLQSRICMEVIHGVEIFLLRTTAGITIRSRAAGTRRTWLLHQTRKRHNRKIHSHISPLVKFAPQTDTFGRPGHIHHNATPGPEPDADSDDTMYELCVRDLCIRPVAIYGLCMRHVIIYVREILWYNTNNTSWNEDTTPH